MNKQEIFNHYSTIIDQMLSNSLYFCTYFQNPFSFSSTIDGNDYDELPENLLISSGATRTCLIDLNYDWVVKFDIHEDALGSNCERELEIYEAAKANHLESYFAEMDYVGLYTREINFYDFGMIERYCENYEYDPEQFDKDFGEHEELFGDVHTVKITIPLYAYRRAEAYDCGCADEISQEQARSVDSPLCSRNIAIAVAFIREYGMEEYLAFSDFGNEWYINDIHFNNIGNIDGHLVLIDFSGYHDTSCSFY